MLKSPAQPVIRLRGVRHNNLKNFDLDLPLKKLIVITGLSGSGKSSLAFDTLFAEGQRRYIETFSPYARQFFDRMDKPRVDSIEGIPPAIAIEQRNAVRTTRSTVGTMTEICDYMKVLWPHLAHLHCRGCGRPVRKEAPGGIWEVLQKQRPAGEEVLITFEVPLTEKLSPVESLALVAKQGYQRLLVDGRVLRLDEGAERALSKSLTVVQDRVQLAAPNRARFVEACEQAYHFGRGKLCAYSYVRGEDAADKAKVIARFSSRLHCADCDLEYQEPSPPLFSYNHPLGACPTCRGFGRVIGIDYKLSIPDSNLTLAQGAVKPWRTGQSAECFFDLQRMCREVGIPMDVPFCKLPANWQELVINGDPDYGKDEEHEWPRAWYGIKGYFRWLESKAYKMHVRVLLSRYRTYTPCPDCRGRRFQPDSLLYRAKPTGAAPNADGLTLADFYRLPVRDALDFVAGFSAGPNFRKGGPLEVVAGEVRCRLEYLEQVGLGYLSLDRPTRTLSGGETERVNLTTCLGTRLVNTLFVLDEPSVGLHPRDTARLVRILQRLRDAGNTVVVVEHEPEVMRAANHLVDLGPGHGESGGQVVFEGTYDALLRNRASLTGQYLSGTKTIEIERRRPVELDPPRQAQEDGSALRSKPVSHETAIPFRTAATRWLHLSGANHHNLKDLRVSIPLDRFVCVTGVSGSGKSTLVRDVLVPALQARLNGRPEEIKASDRLGDEADDNGLEKENRLGCEEVRIEGGEHLSEVVLVEQTLLGKTPRSTPAVYAGAFDHLRELFADAEPARQRGLAASAFSFNSAQGQCERCRGAGFEKIEMQFLSDVFVRCPDCDGRRYRAQVLEATISPPGKIEHYSIADLLESTIDDAVELLARLESTAAARALEPLRTIQEVGLGYLRLGQPINTLSGGESQRLKLVRYLAATKAVRTAPARGKNRKLTEEVKPILFVFDEPTTGLHFEDIAVLLRVFQRLVDAGHSLLVIEHNLEVIKSADWLIDLGPDAGDQGGQIVGEGTPGTVAAFETHTGKALRQVLRPEHRERKAGRRQSLETSTGRAR